jgi:hypothetical protein
MGCRPRFVVSGRPLLDSSHGELPLDVLPRFPSSLGPFPCRAGILAELAVRRRLAPSRRPAAAVPRPHHCR